VRCVGGWERRSQAGALVEVEVAAAAGGSSSSSSEGSDAEARRVAIIQKN
jgi:hypothetical protein